MYPTKRVQRSYLPMLWKKLALFGFKSDEQTLTSFVVEAFLFRWTQNISRDPCEEWTYFNMSCQWVTLQKLFSKIFVSRLVIGKYQDFVLGQTLKPPLSLSTWIWRNTMSSAQKERQMSYKSKQRHCLAPPTTNHSGNLTSPLEHLNVTLQNLIRHGSMTGFSLSEGLTPVLKAIGLRIDWV